MEGCIGLPPAPCSGGRRRPMREGVGKVVHLALRVGVIKRWRLSWEVEIQSWGMVDRITEFVQKLEGRGNRIERSRRFRNLGGSSSETGDRDGVGVGN